MRWPLIAIGFTALSIGTGVFVFSHSPTREALTYWIWGVPELDCPAIVEVSEFKEGEIVTSSFDIGNSGEQSLILTHFQTNCGCAGVEKLVDDIPVKVESLTVPAHSQERLQIRWAARSSGFRFPSTVVRFTTNDPRKPEFSITFTAQRVVGGVYAIPAAMALGSLWPGENAPQIVHLWDRVSRNRAIAQVTVSPAETVQVRQINNPVQPVLRDSSDRYLGAIEVRVQTGQPGRYEAKIQVQLDDDEKTNLVIPLTWEIPSPVTWVPSTLVLPRRSEHGLVYSGKVRLQSSNGQALRVQVQEAPADLRVSLTSVSATDSVVEIQIDWDPSQKQPTNKRHVHLQVNGLDQPLKISIPVHCLRDR